jgi:hypothetical protein
VINPWEDIDGLQLMSYNWNVDNWIGIEEKSLDWLITTGLRAMEIPIATERNEFFSKGQDNSIHAQRNNCNQLSTISRSLSKRAR